MTFKKEDILAQLDSIIADEAFSRSKINVRLLKYLVTATLENKSVKETSIGTDFFGSKYDPIKSDNKVRVYIYHLRKKLNEYYSSKASSDEIIFTIAKGQYNVQFSDFRKKSKLPKTQSHKVLLVSTLTSSFLLILFIFFHFYQKPANNFWKSLMQNDFPTTVVFGDYFTIETQIKTGRKGIIRDYDINNEQELNTYLEKHPEHASDMIPSYHHYFNWMAPECSMNMTKFWANYNYPFDIVQMSEWSVSQLEKDNLVYFGQSKAMGALKNILLEKFPHYALHSQLIVRTNPANQEKVKYWDVLWHEGKNIDYTIVAKLAMPAGNEMRFFLSDQDCGAITALQYFTQNDSVDAFYKRNKLNEDDDFIALFKVSGWQRKSYDMEFVLIDKQ